MGRFAAVAVLLAVVAGCAAGPTPGAERLPQSGGPARPADAPEEACAPTIDYDGNTYLGHGELVRSPSTTGRTEVGLMPTRCNDQPDDPQATGVAEVTVEELRDLPIDRGFLWKGTLYVRADRRFPVLARGWFEAPPCRGKGSIDLAGQWLGVRSRHEPRFDGDLRPPYRLEVRIDDGPDEYRGSTIEILATRLTHPGIGPVDVRRSLWRSGELHATAHCDKGRFVADALSTTAD